MRGRADAKQRKPNRAERRKDSRNAHKALCQARGRENNLQIGEKKK